MKKLLVSLFALSLLVVSCGEGGDAEKEDKKAGPSLCECVNLDKDEADEDVVEKCEEMEEKWKEKFKEASDEEKEEMRAKVQACEDKK